MGRGMDSYPSLSWGIILHLGLYLTTFVISAKISEKKNTNDKRCHMFSVGNHEKMEFYSPYYPNEYPNETECILVLKADPGHQIEVDFRDFFLMEDHKDCDHDFLEIRDGPYGYSDLKGKYCGTSDYPPIITSKDRYLWLRFNSDETIENKGFRGVYRYVESPKALRQETHCEFQKTGNYGNISYADIPQSIIQNSNATGAPLDCVWVIEVEDRKKIYMYFDKYTLNYPNECGLNYIDIYDGARDCGSRIKHFCGAVADTAETKGNLMYFRYYSTSVSTKANFLVHYTAFREPLQKDSNNYTCEMDEFDCQDVRCIHISLKCDTVKNCRHENDEENCEVEDAKKFNIAAKHIIVILTIGCGLLGGMCCTMCVNCVKKLVRDGKQIHENIRRSREQLEERRSASVASSPRVSHRVPAMTDDGSCFIEGKSNGHTCVHVLEEDDTEEVEEEDEDEDGEDLDDDLEDCVEMRDCECQTRDSLLTPRDSGSHGTPPPPPPPTRRPPGLPPMSPLVVPTPPPPPASHYGRPPHPQEPFGHPYVHGPQTGDHYKREISNDPYRERYRAEAVIQMRDRGHYEPSKTEKSKPDVLVTH